MMALDNNTFLFSTQPFVHGDANELLDSLEMESPLDGFLEDGAFSWVENCKRRRLAAPSSLNDAFPTGEDLEDLFQSFWDSSGCGEISSGANGTDPGRSLLLAGPTVQPTTSPQFHEESPSSDSSQIESLTALDPPTNQANCSIPQVTLSTSLPFKSKNFNSKEIDKERESDRKRKLRIGIISPFVVVKPGGMEGCITVDEINRKILTRPAKPVRHPVGEFACAPRVSTSGPGLSGKSVVSLIRINTRGNGTITIIRTRE